MSELKPCPFCGGTTAHFHEGSTFRWLVIECDECGATPGEVRVQTLGNGTPDDWRKQGEADAIAAWNRRHEITPQAGEAEPYAWVYEFDDPDPQTDIEFGAECPKGWKRHIARGAVYPLYRTTPPQGEAEPVAWMEPHERGTINAQTKLMEDGWTDVYSIPLYRTAPPSLVGPTAGDILISRDAAMTVLARWVYDEHWMKASDDMLAVAVQPSPVTPGWRPIETCPERAQVLFLLDREYIRGRIHVGDKYTRDDGIFWTIAHQNRHETHWDVKPIGWMLLPPDSPGTTGGS